MESSLRTKRHRWHFLAIGLVTIVALLSTYALIYMINSTGGTIVYLNVDTNSGLHRHVPKFVLLQEASEIVFRPLISIHSEIDPDRFAWGPSKKDWPEFRTEWQ